MAKKAEVVNEVAKKPYLKHHGRNPKVVNTSDEGVELYLSYQRNLSFFVEDNMVIEFDDRQYYTNDKDEIEFLNNQKALGILFWHKEYPPDIVKKFKKDAKYLTRSEDDFTAAEA
jgi:hypothetical protein